MGSRIGTPCPAFVPDPYVPELSSRMPFERTFGIPELPGSFDRWNAVRYAAAEIEHLPPDPLRGAGTKEADVPNLRERQIRRCEIDAIDRRRAEASQQIRN